MKSRCRLTGAMVLVLVGLAPSNASAAAWTLEAHHWQLFNATTISSADAVFGAKGGQSSPTTFRKLLSQNTFEYGLTDNITLFATPAYVSAAEQMMDRKETRATGSSLEAGARILLFAHFGKLSLQSSYKAAGPFDLSTSANRSAASQVELRLLYGNNFKLFADDGFVDLQAAQRWISSGHPDETVIDITAGLWLRHDTMVMAQSFNIVSTGSAKAPFTYFRSHKLHLSVVERLSRHWSLQAGAFLSPAGQNALAEKGVSLVLWTQD